MIRSLLLTSLLLSGLLLSGAIERAHAQDSTAAASAAILRDGNFAGGQGRWRVKAMGDAKATAAVEDSDSGKALHVTVSQPSSEAWHVELQNEAFDLGLGKTYTIHFKVKSKLPGHITVKLMLNHAPYSTIWKGEDAATGADWLEYTQDVPISATATVEQVSEFIVGGMANKVNDYWFTDFSIVPKA